MPNPSSKESDRRYGKRKSSDEEHSFNSRSSSKDKKSSMEVKQPIRSVGEWSEFMSSSGKIYYYNCKTEKAQWDKPDEWDWLILQFYNKEKNDKDYYSKDYRSNRYRNKYDDEPFDSKRYGDTHKAYDREYSNAPSSSSSSSFRQNSYSYNNNNNLNKPSHRTYPNSNMQSSMLANTSATGAEYYENNANISPSSSNDYYNYGRNFGPPSKNDTDKYWNDSRSKQEANKFKTRRNMNAYKMSPTRYPPNYNYDDSIHGNKNFMYQKHPSRYEQFNEKNSDQYHYNSGNSYYNSNDIEMKESRYSSSSKCSRTDQQMHEANESYHNASMMSRTSSRSKSTNSDPSRSPSSSRRSSLSNSSSSSYAKAKEHKKSKKKSRKRSKKHHEGKSSKQKTQQLLSSPSPSKSISKQQHQASVDEQTSEQATGKIESSEAASSTTNQDTVTASVPPTTSVANTSIDDVEMTPNDVKVKEEIIVKEQASLEDTKPDTIKSELDNEQIKIEPTTTSTSTNSQSTVTSINSSFTNHNSVFMPVLLSTVEDINKYYKPELLTRLTGIDLNENLNLINSQAFMKHLNCTSLSAELKNYRSLVRFKEIKKTLQEQRLQFLQNQMKEIEELLN